MVRKHDWESILVYVHFPVKLAKRSCPSGECKDIRNSCTQLRALLMYEILDAARYRRCPARYLNAAYHEANILAFSEVGTFYRPLFTVSFSGVFPRISL